jgi:hypothetical protein
VVDGLLEGYREAPMTREVCGEDIWCRTAIDEVLAKAVTLRLKLQLIPLSH